MSTYLSCVYFVRLSFGRSVASGKRCESKSREGSRVAQGQSEEDGRRTKSGWRVSRRMGSIRNVSSAIKVEFGRRCISRNFNLLPGSFAAVEQCITSASSGTTFRCRYKLSAVADVRRPLLDAGDKQIKSSNYFITLR